MMQWAKTLRWSGLPCRRLTVDPQRRVIAKQDGILLRCPSRDKPGSLSLMNVKPFSSLAEATDIALDQSAAAPQRPESRLSAVMLRVSGPDIGLLCCHG